MRHNRFQLKIEKLESILAIKDIQLAAALEIIQQIAKLPDHVVLNLVNEKSGLTPEQIKQGNSMLKPAKPVQQQFSNRKTEVYVRTSRLPKQKDSSNGEK